MDTMYKTPSETDLKSVQVTTASVRGEEEPKLIMKEPVDIKTKVTRKKVTDESA